MSENKYCWKKLKSILGMLIFWRRYNPNPCEPALIEPLPQLDSNTELYSTLYDSAVKLVVHDDALNWAKFYNMIYVNLALTAAYAFAVDKGVRPFLWLMCFFGIFSGVIFDLTLREGMRCLAAHRCKVDVLDARFAVNQTKKFLFCGNAENRREALTVGPLICILFWIGVAIATFWVNSTHALLPHIQK